MAYFLGGDFGASTLSSTLATTSETYDPVYDDEVNAEFIWNILPSAYQVMEDKEVFTESWNGMIRIVSASYLDMWQATAAFSLRDVPIHQQRKWLKYEFLKEILFDIDPELVFVGAESQLTWDEENFTLTGYWSNRYGQDKATVSLNSSSTEDGSLSWVVTVSLSEVEPYGTAQFGYFYSEDRLLLGNALVVGLTADSNGDLFPFVGHYSPNGFLTSTIGSYELAVDTEYILDASYEAKDKILSLSVYQVDGTKTTGTAGITDSTDNSDIYTAGFSDSSKDFEDEGVESGDYLVIDTDRYEIYAVAGDTLVVTSASLPAGVSGISYSIVGRLELTRISLNLIDLAADPTFTVDSFGTASLDLRRVFNGSTGTFFDGASDVPPPAARRKRLVGYTKSWTYFDPTVSNTLLSVPILQDQITSPDFYLHEGTDFEIRNSAFQFKEPPTAALWAEYSTYDERVLYKNFGANVGLDEQSSQAYKSKIRGLYYAYYRGPTPSAIRTGVQILLGLPIADEAGTVDSINTTYSGEYGQINIDGVGYLYPLGVGTSLQVGDSVNAFDPLSNGVEIKDYISHPEWFIHFDINEIEKYHTFAVFVNIDIFDEDTLALAASFVETVKPTWKSALYVGYKSVYEEVDLDDDLTIIIALTLYDIPSDGPPLVEYDGTIYSAEDADWAYDQGDADWGDTSAAMRGTAKIYTSDRLQGVYSDSQIRPYLTGTATLTNGLDSVVGSGTAWESEIAVGVPTDTYIAIALVTTGTDGVSEAGSNIFTDTVTGFTDLEQADIIEIDSVEYQVQSIDSGTQITLDSPLPADATGVSWTATGKLKTWCEVAIINADDDLDVTTVFPGTTGTYKISLLDPDYRQAFYDQFVEDVPQEEVTFVADLSPGYQETLLIGTAEFTSASAAVVGTGTDWVNEIGGPGAVTDKYIVDNEGTWYLISSVTDADDLTLSTTAGKDLAGTLLHLADEVLAGTLTWTNGVATVSCSVSLSGVVAAGDWIQSVPGSEPVVEVLSIDGPGTTITLVDNYAGTGGATKALRRGSSAVLPLTIGLPNGNQDFTDWFGTPGGELSDTLVEP